MNLFEGAQRPVILLGHGLRLAGGADLAPKLLTYGVPVLSSWQALDMLDSDHPMNFGRPGLYGQRLANRVLARADFILAIGNRLSIWNAGYEAPKQNLTMVDIDGLEAAKFPHATWIRWDARDFVDQLPPQDRSYSAWTDQCQLWRRQLPWIESPTHDHPPGFLSPYLVMEEIGRRLAVDAHIVTDMGTAMICAHQVLRLKPPQRIMTSGGLGEMGVALPAAIGASIARGGKEVLCLHCDGGMMMNLHALETIAHHQLPVKIVVFSNDGYLMIKRTQRVLGMRRTAVDKKSGVSCPNFRLVAQAFGIRAGEVFKWEDLTRALDQLFGVEGPALVEVHIDPQQPLVPKLDPIRKEDGTIESPPFDRLSPVLEE